MNRRLAVLSMAILAAIIALTSNAAVTSSDEPEASVIVQRIAALGAIIETDNSCFPRTLSINLANTRTTDNEMKLMANLPNLRILDVSGTAVTANGIRSVCESVALRELYVSRLELGDRDLECLFRANSLRALDLSLNPALSGTGFRELSFPQLRRLDLSGPLKKSESKNIFSTWRRGHEWIEGEADGVGKATA